MTAPAADPVGAPGWLAETTALIAKRDALEPSSVEAADEFVDLQDELAARAPVLVAALEAVLALADKWQEPAGYPSAQAVAGAEERAWCAGRVREVIEEKLRDAQGGAGQ